MTTKVDLEECDICHNRFLRKDYEETNVKPFMMPVYYYDRSGKRSNKVGVHKVEACNKCLSNIAIALTPYYEFGNYEGSGVVIKQKEETR